MKILVTGANGYLGQGIINELIKDGYEVIASDICFNQENKYVKQIAANIFELDDPYTFFDKPEIVLHTAWRNGFVHNDSSHMEDLPKHISFLNKMMDGGAKQIVVMGSMHEVGYYEGEIDENTPCNPLSIYAQSKNSLREYLEKECNKRNVVLQWLRGFYIVGNIENGNSIFSKIYKKAKEGETKFPFTSGKNKYDFLDYDVFCKYVAHTVEQTKINGIINICSGKPVSLGEKVEKFIKDNNLNIKLSYGEFPDRPYDSKAIWGNNSKIIEIEKNHGK